MQLTWWGRWQPPGAQSSDDRALSRQVEHQYRVEPEEDARSEGTQGSQEAAQGKLAALDIDLCCSWWLRVRLGSASRTVIFFFFFFLGNKNVSLLLKSNYINKKEQKL